MVRLILFGMFRGRFQRENKFSPHAFRTDDRDVLFVLIDDLFHNRQTEAVALSLAAAGGVGFIKPIPYFVQRIGRDAHAVIFHGDKDLSVTDIAFNFYGAVVPAELDRIINKVVQHLLDLSEIGRDKEFFFGEKQADRNLTRSTDPLKGCGCLADDGMDVKF